MPPLWQYFSRLLKADESIPDPKGHGPPGPCGFFSLQTGGFQGRSKGTVIGLLDPLWAGAVLGAKAMPPLWQYFFAKRKKSFAPMAVPKERSI
jgi:hypothetical protein